MFKILFQEVSFSVVSDLAIQTKPCIKQWPRIMAQREMVLGAGSLEILSAGCFCYVCHPQ